MDRNNFCDEKASNCTVVSTAKVENTLGKLKRQIARLQPRVNDLEARKAHLSVHGHQDLGYFRGKLSAMQDIAEELEEILKENF